MTINPSQMNRKRHKNLENIGNSLNKLQYIQQLFDDLGGLDKLLTEIEEKELNEAQISAKLTIEKLLKAFRANDLTKTLDNLSILEGMVRDFEADVDSKVPEPPANEL